MFLEDEAIQHPDNMLPIGQRATGRKFFFRTGEDWGWDRLKVGLRESREVSCWPIRFIPKKPTKKKKDRLHDTQTKRGPLQPPFKLGGDLVV